VSPNPSHLPNTDKKSVKWTAQQWAWQFLRRNLKYREAWTFLSSLSPEQQQQLQYLIEMRNHTLINDAVIDLDVVRTLDWKFFDQKYIAELDFKDTTLAAYLDDYSGFDDFDLKVIPPVSDQFQLETYCLQRWLDPDRMVTINVATAAWIWNYNQHKVAGLEHSPEINAIMDAENKEFRPLQKSSGTGKGKARKIGVSGPLVKGADGNIFLRSPTIWGHDYEVPTLQATQVDIRFDLAMPIKFQINQAKAALETHLNLLSKGGFLPEGPKSLDKNGSYSEYLRILDRLAEGANSMDIVRDTKNLPSRLRRSTIDQRTKARVHHKVFFDPNDRSADQGKITETMRQKMVRAIRLCDYGYKALAFM